MIGLSRHLRTSLEIFHNSWCEDLQVSSEHLYWRPHSGLFMSQLKVSQKEDLSLSLTIITIN